MLLNRQLILCLSTLILGLFSCGNLSKKNNESISEISSIDSISELISRDKKDASLYAERAQEQTKIGNIEQAIQDLTMANSLDSLNVQYYIDLADFYIQLGNSGITKNILERANQNINNNAAILYRLGNLYFYIQDYTNALSYLNKSIKIDPYYPMAYFSRGMLMLEQKDTANAITNFQIAVEREPAYFEAYLQLGLIHLQLNNDLSLLYYDNAINLQPLSYEAHYGKAMYFQKQRMPQKAIETYRHMLSKHIGQNEQLYYNIGYNFMNHLNQHQEAIEYFDSAIISQPYFTEAYCNRAFCYEQTKQSRSALNDYQKALGISPGYPLAVDGIKRINKN